MANPVKNHVSKHKSLGPASTRFNKLDRINRSREGTFPSSITTLPR